MEYIYSFDKNYNYNLESSNENNVAFSLTFNNIKVSQNYESFNPIVKKYNITFYVYAFLYPINSNSEELVNTSSLIYTRKYLYQNKTKSICYYDKNIKLYFDNVSRMDNYTYDLTLKINAFIDNNLLNEEFLVYTIGLNLTDIGKKTEPSSKLTMILLIIIGVVLVIVLVIVFIFVFKRMKKKRDNINLEDKSIPIDSGEEAQKQLIITELENKNVNDYFI